MRKKCLSLCLSAAMLLPCIAFSACNPGGDPNISETGEVTLRFWNGFTGMDGDSMDAIVADFNEEYAGEIKVETDKMDWDTLFTKLTTTKSNLSTAPHVVAMSNQRLAGIVDQDLLMAIDDLPEYLGVTQSDYISSAWNSGVIGGTRYSFPLDIHPTAMFYNKDLISEEELPSTWEEFVEICVEKTNTETGVYGFAVPSMYSITKDIFASILLQNGGALFDAENNAVYNSDQGDAALEFLSDLVYTYKVSPENVGAGGDYTLFMAGRSVFYFDGPWLLNTFDLIKNGDTSHIGVAPMPGATGENGISFSGSHQLTLMKNTVTSERVKEACYTFIQYIQTHSLEWAYAGQVPAYLPTLESEEYQQIEALQPFTQTALNAQLGQSDYKYFYEGYNYMGVAVSNAISGKYSAAEALDRAVRSFSNWIIDNEY